MDEKPLGSFANDEREGRYANFFNIGHNAFEVILEFGQFFEGNKQPHMHTRILMSPVYARTFQNLLRESLLKYEQVFGKIPTGDLHD